MNNNLIGTSSLKGSTSANIHINNYYTNNIYNAIYNNYLPHKIFNKNGKINKKNIKHQRASSVLAPKRSSSKFKTYKKKEKNTKIKENVGLDSKTKRIMGRTNSSNKVSERPNSEYILNKNKSKSICSQI